jgi:hypothetical protein
MRSKKEGIRVFEKKYGQKTRRKLAKFFEADELLKKARLYSGLGFTDCEIAKCINAICGVNVCRQQVKRWRKKDFLK